MRITTKEQFGNMEYSAMAVCSLGLDESTDDNFWMAREKARMLSGEYTVITINGDHKERFLHVSADDLGKVAYTKDADNGRADTQTRTTLAAYCEKYGLQEPAVIPAVTANYEAGSITDCMEEMDGAIGRVRNLMARLRSLLG